MGEKPWHFESAALKNAAAQAVEDRRAFADAISRPRSKYGSVRTTGPDGTVFASKAEAKRDAELKLLERAGKIRDLERQPRFKLIVKESLVCTYVGDWRYWDFTAHCVVVEDRKGALTPAFKIKWALAKALHPEIEWRLS